MCLRTVQFAESLNTIRFFLQTAVLERLAASEEERMNSTALWFGHKACRPATTKQKRRGWSLEDVTVGSYVCFEADKTSEYWLAGFELGKVLTVASDLTDEAKLQVDYHQFDP
ncbi:hypothetical protein ABBQ32_004736 [Trebouxia sp. C0010 RCD-2024]